MSSSPQSVRRTKRKVFISAEPRPLPCPQCGRLTMRRVQGPCTLQDETIIPDLERFQCGHCQANFFDEAAMRTIAGFRQQRSDKSQKRKGRPQAA